MVDIMAALVLTTEQGNLPWETILNVGVSPVVVLLLVLGRRLWPDGAYQAQVDRKEPPRAGRPTSVVPRSSPRLT